jgi:hypothetical protein
VIASTAAIPASVSSEKLLRANLFRCSRQKRESKERAQASSTNLRKFTVDGPVERERVKAGKDLTRK